MTVVNRTATTLTISWKSENRTAFHNVYLHTPTHTVLYAQDYTQRTISITNLSPSTMYSAQIFSGNVNRAYETVGATNKMTTCQFGYSGAACTTPVCSPACASTGTCVRPNLCQCSAGYDGLTCADCKSGYYRSNGGACVQCPACDQGYCLDGNSGSGQCQCNNGWTGALCNTCAAGYYKSSPTTCTACPTGCSSCTSASQCTACSSPFVLNGGVCISQCGPGTFLNGDMCVSCESPCANCASITSCTSCVTTGSYFLDGSSCVTGCSARKYPDAQRVCRDCDSRCLSCAGPGVNQCSSCAAGYVLQNSTCITASACTSSGSYIPVGTSECRPCDATCAQCSGSAANQCTSCASPKVLQSGSCQAECSAGFAATSSGVCNPCVAPCATCSSLSSGACLSCLSELGLLLDGSTCVTSCPANKFSNGTHCVACDASCATCTGALANQCSTCAVSGKFIYGGACVDACPGGHFDDESRRCVPCSGACSNCTGSATYCTSCTAQTHFAFDGACIGSCPQAYFYQNDSCALCNTACAECNGPENGNCTTCAGAAVNYNGLCISESACTSQAARFVSGVNCLDCDAGCRSCATSAATCTSCSSPQFLSGSSCVSVCPAGTYASAADRKCHPCTSPCATCSSALTSTCESCVAPLLLDGGVCRASCPAGKFNSTGTCLSCDSGCATCDGEQSTDCLSCKNSYEKIDETGACTIVCNSNQFLQGETCVDCDPDCKTCGTSAAHCTSCATPLLASGGDCIHACPFNKVNVSNACANCDSSCLTCSNTGPASCLSCRTGYVLLNGYCVTAAQCTAAQRYVSGVNCLPCHADCRTCTGSGANQCTQCVDSALSLDSGRCVSACDPGDFLDTATSRCLACSSTCTNCTSTSTTCTACAPGKYLVGTVCVDTCPQRTYANDETRQCLSCFDSTCTDCTDGSQSGCIMCDPPRTIFEGRCMNSCDDGKYLNTVGPFSFCVSCPANCGLCSNGHTCTRCYNDTFVLLDGQCVSSCPTNYYLSEGKCSPCHGTCARCFGPDAAQCTQCDAMAGLFLDGNACTTELACADSGKYADAHEGRCLNCDASCALCGGAGPNQCLACARSDYVLESKTCQASCSAGHYQNGTSCVRCDSTCATCASSSAVCTSCPVGYNLYNEQCSAACPPSYFPDQNGVCQPCHASCSACTGGGISECIACSDPTTVLDNGYCNEECSPGSLNVVGYCTTCDAACLTCAKSLTNCLVCASPSQVLLNGACLDECPAKFFSNGTRTCEQCHTNCASCAGTSENDCLTCVENRQLDIQNSTLSTGSCDCPVGTFTAPNSTAYQEAFQRGICLDCTQLEGGCAGLLAESNAAGYAMSTVIPFAAFLLLALLCFFLATMYPRSDMYLLMFVFVTLFDAAAQVYFCLSLMAISSLSTYFYASVASLGATILFNIGCIIYVFNRAAYQSPYVLRYFEQHLFPTAVIGLLSMLAAEFLTVLSSRLFNFSFLALTWPPGMEAKIVHMGLGLLLLQNIPHLVLQVLVFTSVGASLVVSVALASTALAIIISVVRRVVFFRMQNKASEASPDEKLDEIDGGNSTGVIALTK